jgi:hypothetical protein
VAELTQKISNLEYKNQELVAEGDLTTSISESDRMRELQDKVACLRAQVGENWRTKENKTQRRQSKNFWILATWICIDWAFLRPPHP